MCEDYFTSGILLPDEMDGLQRVYDKIVGRAWFEKSEGAREAFAAYLIVTYQRGMTDFEELENLAGIVGAARYSKRMLPGRRERLSMLASGA